MNERHKTLIGKKFNRLTILDIFKPDNTKYYKVKCKCDCGNEKISYLSKVEKGEVKSCGCFRKDMCRNFSKQARKYNKIEVIGEVTRIYINGGDYTEIDTEDYPKVSQYWWRKNRTGYICSRVYSSKGSKTIFMHRLILNNVSNNLITHHIDHNILNNRKSNLKNVTASENISDSSRKLSKSGYRNIKKAIYKSKNGNVLTYYEVFMSRKGKRIYIGNFKDLDKAIESRDSYCKENNIFINKKGEK